MDTRDHLSVNGGSPMNMLARLEPRSNGCVCHAMFDQSAMGERGISRGMAEARPMVTPRKGLWLTYDQATRLACAGHWAQRDDGVVLCSFSSTVKRYGSGWGPDIDAARETTLRGSYVAGRSADSKQAFRALSNRWNKSLSVADRARAHDEAKAAKAAAKRAPRWDGGASRGGGCACDRSPQDVP